MKLIIHKFKTTRVDKIKSIKSFYNNQKQQI